VQQPKKVVLQKSVVVRQKRNGVWDKKFIKKSLDRVERKWGGTQHQITVTNQLVTYYNEPKQNITWTKIRLVPYYPYSSPIIPPTLQKTAQIQRKTGAKNDGLYTTIPLTVSVSFAI